MKDKLQEMIDIVEIYQLAQKNLYRKFRSYMGVFLSQEDWKALFDDGQLEEFDTARQMVEHLTHYRVVDVDTVLHDIATKLESLIVELEKD